MFDKKHIESILRINGIAETAPDEEIRSVLVSARFDNDEVETAMMVLRENTKTNVSHVDGLHKVFRTDQALQPAEISRLLGIDIHLETPIEQKLADRRFTFLQVFLLWTISMIIAATTAFLYMYNRDIGPFHPSNAPIVKT
jgi:hypothetical protein